MFLISRVELFISVHLVGSLLFDAVFISAQLFKLILNRLFTEMSVVLDRMQLENSMVMSISISGLASRNSIRSVYSLHLSVLVPFDVKNVFHQAFQHCMGPQLRMIAKKFV
jgi:hypothetical protein